MSYGLDPMAQDMLAHAPDKNLFEFDLTLWTLLHKLVVSVPQQAVEHFGMTIDACDALASSSKLKLNTLASGVMISFQLSTDENEIIDFLGEEYDPTMLYSEINQFETAYWLLLKRLAGDDVVLAATAFGISSKLAQACTDATDNQLHYLANNLTITFNLRFNPDLLPGMLEEHGSARGRLFLKKYMHKIANYRTENARRRPA